MSRKSFGKYPSFPVVEEYVSAILAGRKIACPELIQACERYRRDLENPAYDFRPADAEFVIRIIEKTFVHQQGERLDGTPLRGRPFLLEPWQVFDLGCTYGWVHKDTGARRFTYTYNKRARGNYKSSEKSCQGLYHMCGDACYPPYRPELAKFEQEPEVECAAVDRTQAMRVLEDPAVADESYFVLTCRTAGSG